MIEMKMTPTEDAKSEALRDAIFALLHNAKFEIDGAMASLNVSDDVGLNHHAKRLFDGLRLVHQKLKELPSETPATPASRS